MNINENDKVYVTKNPVWGLAPMRVLEVRCYDNGVVAASCKHPTFGIGNFNVKLLEKVTKSRTLELKKFKELKKELEKLEKKLFKK